MPYDECVVLLRDFPHIYQIEGEDTYRDFYYIKAEINIELKFKNYNKVTNILHGICYNLNENIIILRKYYTCVVNYLQNNIVLIDDDLEENYIICSLLQKKYENKNICLKINKKYEYILKRKNVYENNKIINIWSSWRELCFEQSPKQTILSIVF